MLLKNYKNIAIFIIGLIVFSGLLLYSLSRPQNIIIEEVKIISGVNSRMAPIKTTDTFPKNTPKICVWIKWRHAKINTQILVKWFYLTDDLPIYNYKLNIPKREGIANVALAMPKGKFLPSGSYSVTLLSEKRKLTKPLTFEIQ